MVRERSIERSSGAASAPMETRETCLRCWRPTSHCYCALVPSLSSTTRVVFVQHPRERDVPIGTALMAHLGLPSSLFVEGIAVDDNPVVADAMLNDAALLFPGEGARPLADWVNTPPRTLVVVDGTWWQAKKVIQRSPKLAGLPRLSYDPPAPGNYRIRREPTDMHLATIEAVAAVLGALEGDPQKFAALLRPFTWMVDRQIEAAAAGGGRLRERRRRHPGGPLFELQPLREDPSRAVILYGEANCHPRVARDALGALGGDKKTERAPGAPELVHLVASRALVTPVERFESILRPRRPLGVSTPDRLGLPRDALVDGEEVASALARFRAFLDGERAPILCTWGAFVRDRLVTEGEPARGFIDLRALTARGLRGSPGGIEGGARALGIAVDDDGQLVDPAASMAGRAGAMLALLERILPALLAR